MAEIRLVIVLVCMLLIPGWFTLAVTGVWQHWPHLQGWILATGIGIGFYPVLFYITRFLFPSWTFGPYKIGVLLFLMAAIAIWRLRTELRKITSFDWLERLALVVFGITLFTRFWIIRNHPFPAWTDSLHHTLITQLTATQGRLPTSVEPYFPVPLDQYHLGLYALTATVQWLAQVPAHTALLWTAQMLNGLCGLGVYLVLDKMVGRKGAIAGAIVAGLYSHQPAFYVNWGRFTQLSSQTVSLIGWIVAWQVIKEWRLSASKVEDAGKLLAYSLLAALLVASLFLLHFRVAAFFLPLIVGAGLWELWQGYREKVFWRPAAGAGTVGLLSVLTILPALIPAVNAYITSHAEFASAEVAASDISTYYHFPLSSIHTLAAHEWLLIITAISLIVGVIRQNVITLICLFWVVFLFALGYTYILQIPLLNLTNLGAILIMLYLPVSLVVGAAMQEITMIAPGGNRVSNLLLLLILFIGVTAGRFRMTDVETYRFFVTPADVSAMDWISHNTPADARFAVNTSFWLSSAPHGTDAGYWIPYFTGRLTTAGMMNSLHGTEEHWAQVVAMSESTKRLETELNALQDLERMGVDYIYIGQRGNFESPGLNSELLQKAPGANIVYQKQGVSIFSIQ